MGCLFPIFSGLGENQRQLDKTFIYPTFLEMIHNDLYKQNISVECKPPAWGGYELHKIWRDVDIFTLTLMLKISILSYDLDLDSMTLVL